MTINKNEIIINNRTKNKYSAPETQLDANMKKNNNNKTFINKQKQKNTNRIKRKPKHNKTATNKPTIRTVMKDCIKN